MIISLIVAASENGVIGLDNQIPWHLPDDLKHFKRITTGHHVVMGRKTFESIGKPLPNRTNIVITRSHSLEIPGVQVVHSFAEAVDLAFLAGETELMVIGGGEIYRQAFRHAQRIYFTRVEAVMEGHAHFPEPGEEWELQDDIPHPADDRHAHAFRFQRYERRIPDLE